MKDLKILDLFNCDVTNIDDYRGKVFQLLDGLEALDGFDQDNKEAEDDESSDEGVFLTRGTVVAFTDNYTCLTLLRCSSRPSQLILHCLRHENHEISLSVVMLV